MAGLVQKKLRIPIVCENKPGAAGALAFSYVVRQQADGYTLGHAPVEIAMVRSLGYADVGPEKMDLLCLVTKTPPVLVVGATQPWKSLGEFVEAARHERGRIIVANSGTGSIWHFNALLLEQACGFRVTHVPFNGSSASVTALLGGHVDAVVAGAGEVIGNVQSGQLRVLAIFDTERSRIYADVPTAAELGYRLGAPAWSGFYAPAGVPEERLALLEQAFKTAFDTPEFQRLCLERGMQPEFMDRRKFREFASQQADFFGREIPQLLRLDR
jgi:tripartite-type tricarboxylate transporter receptor subunit TctC